MIATVNSIEPVVQAELFAQFDNDISNGLFEAESYGDINAVVTRAQLKSSELKSEELLKQEKEFFSSLPVQNRHVLAPHLYDKDGLPKDGEEKVGQQDEEPEMVHERPGDTLIREGETLDIDKLFEDQEDVTPYSQDYKVRLRPQNAPPKLRYADERKLKQIDKMWNSTEPLGFTMEDLKTEQQKDVMTRDLVTYFTSGELPLSARRQRVLLLREFQCFVVDDILYHMTEIYNNGIQDILVRIWLPKGLQCAAIKMMHFTSGHSGIYKCFNLLCMRFIFPQMLQLTKALIVSCEHCQMYKRNMAALTSERHLYDEKVGLFQVVHADFLGEFDSSYGYKYILVMIDRLTNYCVLSPLRTLTAEAVARRIENDFFKYFGCFQTLITDNGSPFQSSAFKKFLDSYNIVGKRISVSLSNSNGKAEQMVKQVLYCLRGLTSRHKKSWSLYLSFAQLYLNSTMLSNTSIVPQICLTGVPACLPTDLALVTPLQPELSLHDHLYRNFTKQQEGRKLALSLHEKRAMQNKQKHDANLARLPIDLQVGNIVYYRMKRLPNQKENCKLQYQNMGPMLVVGITEKGSIKLKNLKTGKVLKNYIHKTHLQLPAFYRAHANTPEQNLLDLSHEDRLIILNSLHRKIKITDTNKPPCEKVDNG